MKEIKVTVNTWYVVEGAAGATVINPLTNRAIATVEDGKQASFLATTPYVVASDDSVNVFKAPFNSAPAKLKLLGLLGGGSSTGLPAGYLEASFLESAGPQYIVTDYYLSTSTGVEISADCELLAARGNIFAFACGLVPTSEGSPWGFGLYTNGCANFSPFNNKNLYDGSIQVLNKRCLFKLKSNSLWVDGVEDSRHSYGGWSSTYVWNTAHPLTLFRVPPPDEGAGISGPTMQAFSFTISVSGGVAREFIPALAPTGTPCMFDLVTKQPFYNSGTGKFIAGFTLAQARKLSKLPAKGGTLTVSLPSNYAEDEGVVNALATAQENGWIITIQTHEAEAGADSTFALRRIWVRKVENEQGSYVDDDGNRWQVEWCVDIVGADPETEGYEPFRSVEAACEYWGLEAYVDPNWEEDFLT